MPRSWTERGSRDNAEEDARYGEHRRGDELPAKLARRGGKAQHAKRKWLSGAPNGWVKEVLGFRRFSARGARKVRGEWHLACLALNIKRMAALAPC